MFNDDYGLTQAVLDGRKTMTRRIIKCPRTFRGEWVAGFNVHIRQSDKKIVDYPCMYDADGREFDGGEILPKYKIGEVVAIAQSYKDAGYDTHDTFGECRSIGSYPGWKNKRFVKAEDMPRHISITNIKIERLQDISDEDCLMEIARDKNNNHMQAVVIDTAYNVEQGQTLKLGEGLYRFAAYEDTTFNMPFLDPNHERPVLAAIYMPAGSVEYFYVYDGTLSVVEGKLNIMGSDIQTNS